MSAENVRLGDCVYWYLDPLNPSEPQLGWICRRPGANTVTILVFAPDIGWVEKPSVRHINDPGLRDNAAWRQWGCWDYADWVKDLQKVNTVQAIATSERRAKKNGE